MRSSMVRTSVMVSKMRIEILLRNGGDPGALDDAPILVEDPAQIFLGVHGYHRLLLGIGGSVVLRRSRGVKPRCGAVSRCSLSCGDR